MDELLLLILCSPSGAGKTTLTRFLLEQMPELTFSVSHTTRAPRITYPAGDPRNEVDGRDYHFVDRARFEMLIAEDRFCEWAEVHGNRYGTSVDEIARARNEGKRGIVFDIDYQGARQIKAKLPHAVGLFILPPSMDILLDRLRGRGSETPEVIARRFAKAGLEIEHYPSFDYLVVNDDLERAKQSVLAIARAEQCRRQRVARHAEMLLSDRRPR